MNLVGAFELGGTTQATGLDPYNPITPDVNGNCSPSDAVILPKGDPTRSTQVYSNSKSGCGL